MPQTAKQDRFVHSLKRQTYAPTADKQRLNVLCIYIVHFFLSLTCACCSAIAIVVAFEKLSSRISNTHCTEYTYVRSRSRKMIFVLDRIYVNGVTQRFHSHRLQTPTRVTTEPCTYSKQVFAVSYIFRRRTLF